MRILAELALSSKLVIKSPSRTKFVSFEWCPIIFGRYNRGRHPAIEAKVTDDSNTFSEKPLKGAFACRLFGSENKGHPTTKAPLKEFGSTPNKSGLII